MRNVTKIGYFILIVIIVALVFSIPFIYDQLNVSNVDKITSEVELALNSNDISSELNEINEEYEFSMIVQSTDYYYSTFNSEISDIENLEIAGDYYSTSDTENGYNYVLVIPPVSFDSFYAYFVFIIFIIVFLILLWNVLIIRFVIGLIIKPMEVLKNNINNLRNYEFSEVENDTRDKINDELLKFSEDLNSVLLQYNVKIVEKEKDFYEQVSLSAKKEQFLTTVIHDFKGELENVKAGSNEIETIKQLDTLKNKTEQSIKLAIAQDESYLDQIETINLKTYIFNILNKKRNILDAEEIFINYYVIDYNVKVNEIELNQLFTNIISNAIKHTNKFGEIDIKLENNTLYFSNDSDEQVDTSKIFRLDYSSKNVTGIGYGMFRIKQIIDELNWELDVYNKDNKFVVEINLGDNND